MKKFIVNTLLFSGSILLFFILACFIIDYSGMSDWAYKRFTVGRQTSLVLGTSRSAQGIQPQVINNYFADSTNIKLPIYNFSFTVTSSPFGEIYFNAIKKILDTSVKEKMGLFIVAVDPWSLSEEEEWDAKDYRETFSCLNEIKCLHMKPNWEYIAYYFHLRDSEWCSKFSQLEDDGWYRVNFSMVDFLVEENIKQKLALYKTYHINKSLYRLKWLEKTIEYLKNYGNVYLCRIPVYSGMLCLEDKHWIDFDKDMRTVAAKYDIPYFSFRNDRGEYRTIDGNHLYKEDGKIFTQNLCDSINTYNNGFN